jgi:hypothetical protein
MPARLEYLIEFQAEIKQCRRLAVEISDPETARRLLKLADEIEDWLREVDRENRVEQLATSIEQQVSRLSGGPLSIASARGCPH